MKAKLSTASFALMAALTSGIAPVYANTDTGSFHATSVERNAYFPGTEQIKPYEMRVTACGTGMPAARPKQAGACFLVELGNGDNFIFDVGTGSMERLAALAIPFDKLDKVFITHLHSDHVGDLDALFVGGMIHNRQVPLRVWGPNSTKPEWGTKFAIDGMKSFLRWDWDSRQGNVNTKGFQIEVTEFDYKGENAVVYQDNGVTIRSIPAVHAMDGPVSYILEWNDLKFAFSGDTYPNKWWMEHTKGVDISIHESFIPPTQLVSKFKFPVEDALNVGTQVHTAPAMFGKIMEVTKPRLAVAYHFYNDFDSTQEIAEQVRTTYRGPLSLANDYMVWNITKDEIKTRMTVVDEHTWPQPSLTKKKPADGKDRVGFTKFIAEGREVFKDVVADIYKDANEKYGSDVKPPHAK